MWRSGRCAGRRRCIFIELLRSTQDAITTRKVKAGKLFELPQAEPGAGLFTILTANQWIHAEQQKPAPKMLFDHFWLQGELCKLQDWLKHKGLRVIVVFEGRDAAGK